MDHYERLQEKKEWIAAKHVHEVKQIQLHYHSEMVERVNKDRDFYREAESKGIHVSCEEIARRSAEYKKYEQKVREWEEVSIHFSRNKAKRYLTVARENYVARSWTCKDDGFAHPFTYRRRSYYRTFNGAVWKANKNTLGDWVGYWNGIYISKGEEPPRPICAIF